MQGQLDVNHVLTRVVDGFLPTGTRDKALLFEIEYTVDCYHEDYGMNEVSQYERYFFLVYRTSNYTKVFFSKSWSDDGMVWEMASDHDSCWNSDGFNEMRRHANVLLDKLRGVVGDKEISEHLWVREIRTVEVAEQISYTHSHRDQEMTPVSRFVDGKLVMTNAKQYRKES